MRTRLLALLLVIAMMSSLAACTTGEEEGNVSEGESLSESDGQSDAEVSIDEVSIAEVSAPREVLADEPVATLGDITVSVHDFVYFYLSIDSQMKSYYGMGVLDINALEPGFADEAKANALLDATEYSVLYELLSSQGRSLSEEEAEEHRANIESEVVTRGGEQEFVNTYGLTSEQFLGLYLKYAVVSNYWNETREAMTVTDDEMRVIYDAAPENYSQVTVRHVLIQPYDPEIDGEEEGRVAMTYEEAKLKAEEILAELDGGADIGALAKEHSTDPGSKDNNGEYTFGRGEMVEPFEEWAYDATREVGDTGIVETDYGFHVMQFMGRTGFDELEDKTSLQEEAISKKFKENHAESYAIIDSDQWVLNEELIEKVMKG